MELTITGATVRRALVTILALAILALAAYGIGTLVSDRLDDDDPFGGAVDTSRYQAVFLTNDTVYFGRLRAAGSSHYELREAYRVSEEQTPPAEENKSAQAVQRVRSITEDLHGPDERMLIPRGQVLLIENLRPDSKLVKAIDEVRAQR